MIFPSQASQLSQRFTGLRFARPSIDARLLVSVVCQRINLPTQLGNKMINTLKEKNEHFGISLSMSMNGFIIMMISMTISFIVLATLTINITYYFIYYYIYYTYVM